MHSRPLAVKSFLQLICAHANRRFYVAVDGEPDDPSVAQRVRQVKEEIRGSSQIAEQRTLFHAQHLGGPVATPTSLSWFFEREPHGIILEDDCLPQPNFFTYMDTALHRYHYDSEIMSVSGFIGNARVDKSNHVGKSRYFRSWGWGSWSLEWRKFTNNPQPWTDIRGQDSLQEWAGSSSSAYFWRRMFDEVCNGSRNNWDYLWQYAHFLSDAASLVPPYNLIRSRGFDSYAQHHSQPRRALVKDKGANSKGIIFPTVPGWGTGRDRWMERHVYRCTWPQNAARQVVRFAESIAGRA